MSSPPHPVPREAIDCLIAGAGFSGLVMAEQLSTRLGWKCVVVEKRDHLGGNAHDHFDAAGVLVHSYGPHYFRSNAPRVVDYLSGFTTWRPVDYEIKSHTAGRYWSFPINLNTFEELIGRSATEAEFIDYLSAVRLPIAQPANSEEVILSQVGRDLYEKFFEGYTCKQWKRHPRELDASVCGRIPIRTNRDNRYLVENFQALPAQGYSALFDNLVAATPGLRVLTSTSLQEARTHFNPTHIVYTGPIDAWFDHCFGALPYRSLRFENESFSPDALQSRREISGKPGFWQPAMQVNYPDHDVPFTRIVEIKHATGQDIAATTIVREFPAEFSETGEPYYPIPAPDARAQAHLYRELAGRQSDVTFVGRLARYQYYNMDQVVAMALKSADDLVARAGFDKAPRYS